MTDFHDSPEKPKRTGTWVSIKSIGQFSGAIASISVVVSFVHDWGFFSALGVSFAQAPTTISDHVQSWLVWLPKVTVVIIILLALEFLTRRIERGMSENEIVGSSQNPSLTRKFRNSPYIFVGFMGPSIVILWLFLGEKFYSKHTLSVGVIITWFVFAKWVFNHPTVRARHSDSAVLSFYWIPPLILLVFSWGQLSAEFGDLKQHASHRIYMNNAESATTVKSAEIDIVRIFDDWILVRAENKKIVWIRLDQISQLELLEEDRPFPGLVCILFKRLCPQGLADKWRTS